MASKAGNVQAEFSTRSPRHMPDEKGSIWGIQTFARLKPSAEQTSGARFERIENHLNDNVMLDIQVPLEAFESIGAVNNFRDHYSFEFNEVLDVDATQEVVYNTAASGVVDAVLDGYNGTIFAYGQTGSGKTYTMTGGDVYAERGVILRTIHQVFKELATRKGMTSSRCLVSYLEIYNEEVFDLLEPSEGWNETSLTKRNAEQSGDVHLKQLSVIEVESEEEALNLLFLGNINRMTGNTVMNEASSRSHCVFTLHLETQMTYSTTISLSKLNLVDLAGSERVYKNHEDDRTTSEGKHINLSLHYLEQVILKLQNVSRGNGTRKPQSHVPYRNSALTTILKDSIGGNCRTVVIATLSTDTKYVFESLSTCRFAERCAQVKNVVRQNGRTDMKQVLQRLQRENASLKHELLQVKRNNGNLMASPTNGSKPLRVRDIRDRKAPKAKVGRSVHPNLSPGRLKEQQESQRSPRFDTQRQGSHSFRTFDTQHQDSQGFRRFDTQQQESQCSPRFDTQRQDSQGFNRFDTHHNSPKFQKPSSIMAASAPCSPVLRETVSLAERVSGFLLNIKNSSSTGNIPMNGIDDACKCIELVVGALQDSNSSAFVESHGKTMSQNQKNMPAIDGTFKVAKATTIEQSITENHEDQQLNQNKTTLSADGSSSEFSEYQLPRNSISNTPGRAVNVVGHPQLHDRTNLNACSKYKNVQLDHNTISDVNAQQGAPINIRDPKPAGNHQSVLPSTNVDRTVNENRAFESRLSRGGILVIHKRYGKPRARYVWVDSTRSVIQWRRIGDVEPLGSLALSECVCVLRGRSTPVLKRLASNDHSREHRLFSILTSSGRTLDFEVDVGTPSKLDDECEAKCDNNNETECRDWVDALQYCLKRYPPWKQEDQQREDWNATMEGKGKSNKGKMFRRISATAVELRQSILG